MAEMRERAVKKQRERRKAKSCADLAGFYVDGGPCMSHCWNVIVCATVLCAVFWGQHNGRERLLRFQEKH